MGGMNKLTLLARSLLTGNQMLILSGEVIHFLMRTFISCEPKPRPKNASQVCYFSATLVLL